MNIRSIIIILFLVGIMVVPTDVQSNLDIPDSYSEAQDLPSLNTFEVLPDPQLEDEPTVIVNGTSPEFSWSYVQDSLYNIVSLNWNHTTGNNLTYNPYPFDQRPKCNEFIFLTQSFTWDFEEFPLKAELDIEYDFELSGGLLSQYVMWYVWLIDSSGTWEDFVEANPTYLSQWRTYHQNLWTGDIRYAWDGVVEDEYGNQEAPDDTLTFAIGLVPSETFENYTGTINGTASLSIREVSLMVSLEVEGDITREPIKVESSSNYFTLEDIAKGPDDSTYLVGYTMSYEYQDIDLALMKWDAQGSVVWTRYLRGPSVTSGRAGAIATDGSIYTTGLYRSSWQSDDLTTMLAKWSSAGSLEWLKTYPDLESYRFESMCIGQNGDVYGCGSRSVGSNYISAIVKWDAAGNYVWAQDWENTWYTAYQIESSPDGNVVVMEYGGRLAKYDPQGNQLWDIDYYPYSGFAIDNQGFIYGTSSGGSDLIVARYSPNGHQVWNTSLIESGLELAMQGHMTGFDVTADGTLFVALLSQTDNYIVKWSSSGQVVDIFTYKGTDWDLFYSYTPRSLSVSKNGLILVVCQSTDGFAMAVFADADVALLTINENLFSGITVGITSSLAALALVLLFSKKPDLLHRLRGPISQQESSNNNRENTETPNQDDRAD